MTNSFRTGAAMLLICCLSATGTSAAQEPRPELLSVRRIWDKAPHNAFTDLARFNGRWVCTFREAPAHTGGVHGSRIRVLVSEDTADWKPMAELSDPRGDIRDAKLAALPDGRLMLLTAVRLFDTSRYSHQSIAFLTRDLAHWDGPTDVGDSNVWLWGVRWHDGAAYSIGYSTGGKHFVRLYKSTDPPVFQSIVDQLNVDARDFPNESAMRFDADGTAHVLLRCEKAMAKLGTSSPPYTGWTWKSCDARVGGPALTRTPAGRLLGAGRLYEPTVHTALFWIDPQTAKITECLLLPSGGDTSYPGLVWDGEVLNLSYYSSHEGKASIYFARVRFRSAAASAPVPGGG